MSGYIYHSVTPWEALPKEKGSSCTPGRIGHVFFFPAKSFATLAGKKPQWFVNTGGGRLRNIPNEEPGGTVDGESKKSARVSTRTKAGGQRGPGLG